MANLTLLRHTTLVLAGAAVAVACIDGRGDFIGSGKNSGGNQPTWSPIAQAGDSVAVSASASSEDGSIEGFVEAMHGPNGGTMWDDMVKQPFSDVINEMVDTATNDPFELLGYHFSQRRDVLEKVREGFLDHAANYPTFGLYLESQGISSRLDITLEFMEARVKAASEFYERYFQSSNSDKGKARGSEDLLGSAFALQNAESPADKIVEGDKKWTDTVWHDGFPQVCIMTIGDGARSACHSEARAWNQSASAGIGEGNAAP